MNESIETISNHIVILGWSGRVARIIRELRDDVHGKTADLRPILVIANKQHTSLQVSFDRVYFVYGELNDPEVLHRANLDRASVLMIPAAVKDTAESDGANVFALLTALSVNPNIRTCLEVAQARNGEILEQLRRKELINRQIEIVSFESVSERLLAQAAINPDVTNIYSQLLSFSQTTNEIYVAEIAAHWQGKTFRELFQQCFEHEVILIGYQEQGQPVINPKDRNHTLGAKTKVWFMGRSKKDGLRIVNPDLTENNGR